MFCCIVVCFGNASKNGSAAVLRLGYLVAVLVLLVLLAVLVAVLVAVLLAVLVAVLALLQ